MSQTAMKTSIQDKLGLFFFIGSLIFFFILKLPFNTFVICSNVNEGYHYLYGQYFLNEGKLGFFGVSLFHLFYAMVLKLFGFGTKSIIVIHIFQTVISILIGVVIYLLTRKVLQSSFYAGLSVLFWVLLQFVPVGGWGQAGMEGEFESVFALEAEYFCVLFSLLSMYFLLMSFMSNSGKAKLLSVFSGLLATSSMMFKASGTIFLISLLCFALYLFLFQKRLYKLTLFNLFYYFIGFVFSLFLFCLFISYIYTDFFSFWQKYFTIGSYDSSFLKSSSTFLLTLWNFMTRGSYCLSNFFLFLFAFLFFAWALTRNHIIKTSSDLLKLFLPLFSIWSIGNICAIIAPGAYAAYYYNLIWPSIAIVFVIVLKDLFTYVGVTRNVVFKAALTLLISGFFIHRIFLVSDNYYLMLKNLWDLNFLSQPESFQDPVRFVTNTTYNPKRPNFLVVADLINSQLPNKEDTFYIFNLTSKHLSFTPFIYIYAKRLPPTTAISDYFYYPMHYRKFREDMLIKDFIRKPPKIIILPSKINLIDLGLEHLNSLFNWLNSFLEKNYHLEGVINYNCRGYLCHGLQEEVETYNIYKRNSLKV